MRFLRFFIRLCEDLLLGTALLALFAIICFVTGYFVPELVPAQLLAMALLVGKVVRHLFKKVERTWFDAYPMTTGHDRPHPHHRRSRTSLRLTGEGIALLIQRLRGLPMTPKHQRAEKRDRLMAELVQKQEEHKVLAKQIVGKAKAVARPE